MNDLYRQLGNNNMNGFMQNFERFRQTFSGNPQQQIQNMLNSGRISQAQYDAAVKKANMFKSMLGM